MSDLGVGIILLSLGILIRYDAQGKITLFKSKISQKDINKMRKYGFIASYIIIATSIIFLFFGYCELLPIEK